MQNDECNSKLVQLKSLEVPGLGTVLRILDKETGVLLYLCNGQMTAVSLSPKSQTLPKRYRRTKAEMEALRQAELAREIQAEADANRTVMSRPRDKEVT